MGELSAGFYNHGREAAGLPPKTDTVQFASMISGIAAALSGQSAQGVAIASGAGANAAQNNRLLHWDEQQRIKLLANGDPKKEARLTEAACALAHCADGMPKDSPTYAYFKGLQDAGANLTAEKALLSTQQDGNGAMLFQYTGVDRYFVDPWTQNKTGTRLAGAGQAGVGVLGAMGSVALCTTGIGCAAGAISGTISVDYALAGAKQSITGNAQTPYGEQALQSLGLSPQAAAYTYAALGLTPVAVDAMFMKAASGVSSGVVGSEVRTAGGVGANEGAFAANEIRFSQNSVSFGKVDRTGQAYTYDDLVTSMRTNGWKGDPVDVVRMPDGRLTSIDNTRISAAREAGINVQANVRSFDSLLTKDEIGRFTKGSQVPVTWGDAITIRINSQSGGFGVKYPYGAEPLPRVTGRPQ